MTAQRYVPAAGRAGLTRLYDPVMAVTMRERAWRPALVDAITGGLPPGAAVVEVGAGTGALAIGLGERLNGGTVIAVDGDQQALDLAQSKSGAAAVEWRHGLADALPVADASADRVVMSLLLHHLSPAGKRAALAEALRVLRPGGRLHVADWGRPRDPLVAAGFLALRILDGFANTRDHAAGRLPQLIGEAGFASISMRQRLRTMWGSLELLEAERST